MKILLTNDDGINAPGLDVLERIASAFGHEIWTVAPEFEQSGKSRSISLTEFVRVRELSNRRFAISGTPSDCVLLALEKLLPERPDLLLSGVNSGQNVAEDTTFSGTVAAALLGMQHGVPSVAISQSRSFESPHPCLWETSLAWGEKVLRPLLEKGWPQDSIINVNFPARTPDDVVGIQVTRQGLRDQSLVYTDARRDLRGKPYYWIGFRGRSSKPVVGTDLQAINDGYVSVSPLQIDLTHEAFLEEMRKTSWPA